MLRERFNRFVGWDLNFRIPSFQKEADVLKKRADELKRRVDDLQVRRVEVAEQRASFGGSLDRLNVLSSNPFRRICGMNAELSRLETEHGKIQRREQEIKDESDAISADHTRLLTDSNHITDESAEITARLEQGTRRVAQANLLLQVSVMGVLAVVALLVNGQWAHGIYLSYYSAVAAITPILMVAGFVEVGVLGLEAAGWVVVGFAIPAIASTGGALYVLASHHSTAYAYSLTLWGLLSTIGLLTFYVVTHTESSRST